MAPHDSPMIHLPGGRCIHLVQPYPEHVQVIDVARGLRTLTRWSRQHEGALTVLLHSIAVANRVPHEHRAAALLHDAAEAYIGDIPTPVKRAVQGLADVSAPLDRAIEVAFGLPEGALDHPTVKAADMAQNEFELQAHRQEPLGFRAVPQRWVDADLLDAPFRAACIWLDELADALPTNEASAMGSLRDAFIDNKAPGTAADHVADQFIAGGGLAIMAEKRWRATDRKARDKAAAHIVGADR